MQKRAQRGGQYGPNGEWYGGGAFIATTERPKGRRRKGSGKQEWEPYRWDTPPVEGARALHALYLGTAIILNSEGDAILNPGAFGDYRWALQTFGSREAGQRVCDAWNLGMRWVSEDGSTFHPQP